MTDSKHKGFGLAPGDEHTFTIGTTTDAKTGQQVLKVPEDVDCYKLAPEDYEKAMGVLQTNKGLNILFGKVVPDEIFDYFMAEKVKLNCVTTEEEMMLFDRIMGKTAPRCSAVSGQRRRIRKVINLIRQKLSVQRATILILVSLILVGIGVNMTIASWFSASSIGGLILAATGVGSLICAYIVLYSDYLRWSKR